MPGCAATRTVKGEVKATEKISTVKVSRSDVFFSHFVYEFQSLAQCFACLHLFVFLRFIFFDLCFAFVAVHIYSLVRFFCECVFQHLLLHTTCLFYFSCLQMFLFLRLFFVCVSAVVLASIHS
jgi:hypothetical protein